MRLLSVPQLLKLMSKYQSMSQKFLLLPVSALNTAVHNEVVPKKVVEKFNFSELKIEEVKFFTQS